MAILTTEWNTRCAKCTLRLFLATPAGNLHQIAESNIATPDLPNAIRAQAQEWATRYYVAVWSVFGPTATLLATPTPEPLPDLIEQLVGDCDEVDHDGAITVTAPRGVYDSDDREYSHATIDPDRPYIVYQSVDAVGTILDETTRLIVAHTVDPRHIPTAPTPPTP